MPRPADLLIATLLAVPLAAGEERTFFVENRFGLPYVDEPVSFDLDLPQPTPIDSFAGTGPCQAEVLAGTPAAATRVRIWTRITCAGQHADAKGTQLACQHRFTVQWPVERKPGPSPFTADPLPAHACGLGLAEVGNGKLKVRLPMTGTAFARPAAALGLPGPVLALAAPGGPWVGEGYLDARSRIKSITCVNTSGDVFFQSRVTYQFDAGTSYTCRTRLFVGKPWVRLEEDMDVGGDARFIFAYGDWAAEASFRTGDAKLCDWIQLDVANPCNDFVTQPGQNALARLCIWTQFNYFGGKQETVALRGPGPEGKPWAVGGFLMRPDRWTRAKVNHVDLYSRPEVDGDRATRGLTGVTGSKDRLALEAWIIDGHREWALFAVPADDKDFLAKAHVQDGIWPLDRLNRLILVWNSDGSAVAPEDRIAGPVGGTAGVVLTGRSGRGGLQHFNGSNSHIRSTSPDPKGWDGKIDPMMAKTANRSNLVDVAITAYMAADDSAYPSQRVMLPWTDPEALNPFYQGMENMNFNADLYRYVATYGLRLAKLGHPESGRFLGHAEGSLDQALDRYVYPQSGCWEESHGYAHHTIKTIGPMIEALRNSKRRDFSRDPRLLAMVDFFCRVHSAFDLEFGARVVPPIGDHGLSSSGPASRLPAMLKPVALAGDEAVLRLRRRVEWLVREDQGLRPETAPADSVEDPALASGWLQGYGAVLRARSQDPRAVVVRLPGLGRLPGTPPTPIEARLVLVQGPDQRLSQATCLLAPYGDGRHIIKAEFGSDGAVQVVKLSVDFQPGNNKKLAASQGAYTLRLEQKEGIWRGTYAGQVRLPGETPPIEVTGEALGELVVRRESFAVLRAGQSWGHHHEDKGSLWFWGRNVHFFGDCGWGSPPGGTYGNPFKQGAASGTQIEFEGINNWTLPCKYNAPWISDAEYGPQLDYANARCLYPWNPALDLSRSSRVIQAQGYDRQVVFLHPDTLVVRDNLDTTCPVVWRMHTYQPTVLEPAGAILDSPAQATGRLAILHPTGAELTATDQHPKGEPLGSTMLAWRPPAGTDLTWTFLVHGPGQTVPKARLLDPSGRVVQLTLTDGAAVVLLDDQPFTYAGHGIRFEGTVGVLRKVGDQPWQAHLIRGRELSGTPE